MKKSKSNIDKKSKYFCAMPEVAPRVFDSNVAPERAAIILATSKKWANGTVLKYYFFKNDKPTWKGNSASEKVVRDAFAVWKNLGIGIIFQEVTNIEEAQIRIGFLMGDGSWSYVGRDILNIATSERTMNFGWNIVGDMDTPIHEIGHTLGLQHEHQNPNAGIVWNEDNVYTSLSQPPNSWSRNTTFHNIIEKLPPNSVQGSVWDPNSVMHYPFEAGMIDKPEQYRNGLTPAGGLSAKDKQWAKTYYPPLTTQSYTTLKQLVTSPITVGNGLQQNFIFKPSVTKKYKIQTIGDMDTVIVFNEEDPNGELHYLSGDDNSGKDNNAYIKLPLIKNRKYVIQVRVLYRQPNSSGGIVVS